MHRVPFASSVLGGSEPYIITHHPEYKVPSKISEICHFPFFYETSELEGAGKNFMFQCVPFRALIQPMVVIEGPTNNLLKHPFFPNIACIHGPIYSPNTLNQGLAILLDL